MLYGLDFQNTSKNACSWYSALYWTDVTAFFMEWNTSMEGFMISNPALSIEFSSFPATPKVCIDGLLYVLMADITSLIMSISESKKRIWEYLSNVQSHSFVNCAVCVYRF